MTRRIPPVRRLLMDAKALINKPEHWIKGKYARSAKGREVDLGSPKARRFCASGAMLRAASTRDDSIYRRANRILKGPTRSGLVAFNDAPSTTHAMVMRLFNAAIRRAKEQGV